jgi:hypothetical protein
MSKLKEFMDDWFPKTGWEHVKTFILESGVELVEQENQKWLPGYTNISKSSKPHHKDWYIRQMEENLFQLHDTLHQVFTINVFCDEEEYVKRQIYGELFVFYLTEFLIPWEGRYDTYFNHKQYIKDRGCYELLNVLNSIDRRENTIIDLMWRFFIEDVRSSNTLDRIEELGLLDSLEKYSKMFKEDLENSRKNYKFVKELNIKNDYCIVGKTSRNHIDFFEAVKIGAIKNIKREFNVELPKEWI